MGIHYKNRRDEALDAMRGMCVLAMTTHHCINYFPGYSLFYWRFVSGAFLFLAGYIVTSLQVPKAASAHEQNDLGWRLLWRGLKLIAMCLMLNATLIFLFPLTLKGTPSSVVEFVENVVIYGDYKTVSFSLLVPIGYTVALSGVLLLFRMMSLQVVLLLGVAIFCYCALSEELIGRKEYYLSFLSIGVFGMATGYAAGWINKEIWSTIWYSLIPWLVMQLLISVIGKGESNPIYSANTMASLLLIGFLAHQSAKWGLDLGLLVQLGQYSLLLYLVQIAMLFALQTISRKYSLAEGVTAFWLAFLLVTATQVLVALGTDWLRKRHVFSDRVYGWVFR